MLLDQKKLQSLNIKNILFLVLIFTCLLIFNYQVLESIHTRWTKFDEAYSHAYFIFFALVFFLAFKMPLLYKITQTVNYLMLAPLIFFVALLSLAKAYQIESLSYLCLVFVFYFSLWFLCGKNYARHFLTPCIFLIFIIPIWDQLTPHLVALTTKVVLFLLEFSSINYSFTIDTVTLAYGSIAITNDCSGLNFLLVSFVLAFFHTRYKRASFLNSILFLLLASFAALFANWIRVYLVVSIGYQSKMQSQLVYSHNTLGFIVFFICYFLVFFLFKNQSTKIKTINFSAMQETLENTRLKNLVLVFLFFSIFLGGYFLEQQILIFYPITSANSFIQNLLLL